MQVSASHVSPAAAAATSDQANPSSPNPAVVTANDFLTLLVTELKNQDPTANNDPNAYVNQLVQVNSLQQLIQINQNTDLPGSGVTPPANGSGSGS